MLRNQCVRKALTSSTDTPYSAGNVRTAFVALVGVEFWRFLVRLCRHAVTGSGLAFFPTCEITGNKRQNLTLDPLVAKGKT